MHALGDRLQQQVADGVPERVIDGLEVVEIETQHPDGFAWPLVGQDNVHLIVERHAVWQIGQRVILRQVRELLILLHLLGDVLEHHDVPAVRHRLK